MISSIFRAIKFAIQNFFRNFWLSLVTLSVLIITLLLVNVVVVIDEIKTSALSGVEDRVDISLDFNQTVPEAEVLKSRRSLQADQRVDYIDIISPDDNLQKFIERYPEIGEKVIPILDKNPLGYTLKLRAFSLSDYGDILTDIEADEELIAMLENTRFNDYRSLTSKAAEISEKINIGAVALAGIFFVIALIIVFNTIRVSIYTHRDEIGIMKLVGATNWFVRLPFLFEAVIYSLLSVGILVGVVFFMLNLLQPFITRFFADFASIDLIAFYIQNGVPIFGIQFLVVLVINTISSLIALGRYLK